MQSKLPEETQKTINLSANAFAGGMWPGITKHDIKQREYVAAVWKAGATEFAQWKVKYDELKERLDKLEAEATERINQIAQLQIEKMELLEKLTNHDNT
jgi:hypothetical protein